MIIWLMCSQRFCISLIFIVRCLSLDPYQYPASKLRGTVEGKFEIIAYIDVMFYLTFMYGIRLGLYLYSYFTYKLYKLLRISI